MKLTLKFKPNDKRRMNRILNQLYDYGEHVGVMFGGSWNFKTGIADNFPYLHPSNCCKKSPSPKRWTKELKNKLERWMNERKVNYTWGR